MSLTINEVIADKNCLSVWVLNTSDKVNTVLDKPKKGDIIVPIKTAAGESIIVKVVNTWIPIDLSLQAAKEDITRAYSFRKMVHNGEITLISEDEAKKILSSDDARIEAERIQRERTGKLTVDTFKGKKTDFEEHNMKPAEGNIETTDIDLTVIDLFSRDDISSEEVRTNLRNIENQLSEKDWTYIMDNTKDEATKALALEHLSKK